MTSTIINPFIYAKAAPTDTGYATGTFSSTNTPSLTIPAGAGTGDLVIFLLSASVNVTTSGWTQSFAELFSLNNSGTTGAAAYKVLTGSEGSTVSVTLSSSTSGDYIAFYCTGAGGTVESQTAPGSSATPDPPSLTTSWSGEESLFVAVAFFNNNAAPSAYPADYTRNQTESHANDTVASAARKVQADTQNPGTFTFGVSRTWVAATIAVRAA